MDLQKQSYESLIADIGNLLASAREQAAFQINTILVQTYWEIGRYILEFEQKGISKLAFTSSNPKRKSGVSGS